MADVRLRATERWFYRTGLPFLVEDYRSSTNVWTRASPALAICFIVLILGSAASFDDVLGAVTGAVITIVVAVVYGLALCGWAIRYTFRGVSDLYRLTTRALPLLLLFIVFLFFNTEVWQVAGGVFLAAFSGFYVTIYTTIDAAYREHFYDRIRVDLERSSSVRRAYVLLYLRG